MGSSNHLLGIPCRDAYKWVNDKILTSTIKRRAYVREDSVLEIHKDIINISVSPIVPQKAEGLHFKHFVWKESESQSCDRYILWSPNFMALRTWWEFSAVADEEEPQTRKGPWTVQEDMQLIRYISLHGEGHWPFLAKAAGLKRTGKSCRLRWINYLRPDLKRSKITPQEERLIIKLQGRWGNRWSRIAQNLPGRTDNEIKNYWRTRIKKRLNLQAETGSSGMDAGSMGSDFLTTSSQRLPGLDSAESPTSFTSQTTEEMAIQTKETPYLQDDSSASRKEDYEDGLQGEIGEGFSQINDDVQQGAALQEHLEGSDELFENAELPYIFSVGSLATLLSSELFADHGATQEFSYMVASPAAFPESESYSNCYSDVLWNILDEET